ncbi:kinase-like domain-containing protein [Hypoxylon sp. NC1633]|nr:kinase-like domain-containing protein [Hypoxylon sp. NC1633]
MTSGENKCLYIAAGDDTDYAEDREKYRPGGYHPIHFGDYLDPKKRFNVIHKLGWGVSSTVWLCLDEESRYYKSVKVMTAEQSAEDSPELQTLKRLADAGRKELNDNYVSIPHEHFWINGPNGRHLCFVSDLLGPSCNSLLGIGIHTQDILTDMAFQVSKGLQYLHKKGICHGDLSPSNILMQLHQYTLMELSDRQLDKYLGPRDYEPLETLSGEDPGPHGPKYLAMSASLDRLERKCRTGKVAIVDFGHSFHQSSIPRVPRWHRQYAGPELLFTETTGGLPRDIWALACTIYEIKLQTHQTQLFSEYDDYTSLIRRMEIWFGPLPTEYREVARTHLETDKRRQIGYDGRKTPLDDTSQQSEYRSTDLDKPLSMSVDEERRTRELLIGQTGWSNPLQVSLGAERICYVNEQDSMGYISSSDDTDSVTSGSEVLTIDQVSEDEDSEEDISTQRGIEFGDFENAEDPVSEEESEENDEELEISLPRATVPGDELERSGLGNPIDAPPSPTDASVTSQGHESNDSRPEYSPTFYQLLGKRAADESTSETEAKRQRTTKESTQEKGEWVERAVTIPREDVLLLSDLLMRMFKHNPKERIDIDAVVQHEFWGDRRNNELANSDDSIEQIPDPISSRTRNRASKVEEQTDAGSS